MQHVILKRCIIKKRTERKRDDSDISYAFNLNICTLLIEIDCDNIIRCNYISYTRTLIVI